MDQYTPPTSEPPSPEPSSLLTVPTHTHISGPWSLTPAPFVAAFNIPKDLTQQMVEQNPFLLRVQQDLLVLTSFSENSSIHWRPPWFQKTPISTTLWTVQNPMGAVTERMPCRPRRRQVMTRRMRLPDDPPAPHIKTSRDWERYCDMYGIPHDFLCEDQVRLLRLGLPRAGNGALLEPPSWPLYPEPHPCVEGDWHLSLSSYCNLAPKFHGIDPMDNEQAECILVDANGALRVQELASGAKFRDEGPARIWSHVPWTKEQEFSCQRFKLKLRFWNSAMD